MEVLLIVCLIITILLNYGLTLKQFVLEPYEETYKSQLNHLICENKIKFNTNYNQTEVIINNDFILKKTIIKKRFAEPMIIGSVKTREEIWHRNFNTTKKQFDQSFSLISLLKKISVQYLNACIPVILYDEFTANSEIFILQKLFQIFPTSFIHGKINTNHKKKMDLLLTPRDSKCRSYILFLEDALITRKILGPQTTNRVIVIPRSSQWKLQEFLSSPESSDIVNLLVIGESYTSDYSKERSYVLYTHQLYTDGLGANRPVVLTSWIKEKLSRPHVNLFPTKLTKGFAGHRFVVAAANQQPFVFRRRFSGVGGTDIIRWEGLEYRLLQTLSGMLNFTFDIVEPRNLYLGSGDAIVEEIRKKRADIGIGGVYVTIDRASGTDISSAHSTDCAAFITLTSKALPRYRAIMGPFQWPVWVALTFAYLIAIFPLAFSDKLTLRHLIGNFGEVENMFWYVFGTFTNSLTFTGENSWSKTKKTSTRMLIGWYWVFTIIITACYTGSIIAFVTLPVFPDTVDSVEQLLWGFYRVGTLAQGGWERWFLNSTNDKTSKLLKNLEYVFDVQEGLRNVTKAFFWPYAFLGSKAQLEYIVQSNYSMETMGKRSALHISNECFSFFGVSFVFPENSIYKSRFNDAILRFQSSGLITKVLNEVSWEMQRTQSGRLLQATIGKSRALTQEERGLTVADTEGMFLLLGIGFLIGGGVLMSEWVGGCTNKCRAILKKRKDDHDLEISAAKSFHPNSLRSDSSGKLNDGQEESSSTITTSSQGEQSPGKGHKRSASVHEANLNKESLLDLYHGPRRRHSTIIVMNGKLISESDASRHSTYGSNHSLNAIKHSTRIVDFKNIDIRHGIHRVEINRVPTPYVSPIPDDSIDIDVDEAFGEKIVC